MPTAKPAPKNTKLAQLIHSIGFIYTTKTDIEVINRPKPINL